jgi:hypothetical protein
MLCFVTPFNTGMLLWKRQSICQIRLNVKSAFLNILKIRVLKFLFFREFSLILCQLKTSIVWGEFWPLIMERKG